MNFVGCPKCDWIWFRRSKGDFSDHRDTCGKCKKSMVHAPQTREEWERYYAASPPARCDKCKVEIARTVDVPMPIAPVLLEDGMHFRCEACR